jgi:hypothetical protein
MPKGEPAPIERYLLTWGAWYGPRIERHAQIRSGVRCALGSQLGRRPAKGVRSVASQAVLRSRRAIRRTERPDWLDYVPAKQTRTAGWRAPASIGTSRPIYIPPMASETEAAVCRMYGYDAAAATILRMHYCSGDRRYGAAKVTLRQKALRASAVLMELPHPPTAPLSEDAYRMRLRAAKQRLAAELVTPASPASQPARARSARSPDGRRAPPARTPALRAR